MGTTKANVYADFSAQLLETFSNARVFTGVARCMRFERLLMEEMDYNLQLTVPVGLSD
jgi:hypothetical protein